MRSCYQGIELRYTGLILPLYSLREEVSRAKPELGRPEAMLRTGDVHLRPDSRAFR
ncbi:hypothetical protein EV356DRAFT_499963 [Viridothelium virens]|uniref:Uncharacterized protein n=1 Tax=Viridothelium virens TaxID=1048519 RepID=A0A6A6HNP7_VIRVR|nr:hypothetical protein EV356DRAFT_499963 [Viridothelium virens]